MNKTKKNSTKTKRNSETAWNSAEKAWNSIHFRFVGNLRSEISILAFETHHEIWKCTMGYWGECILCLLYVLLVSSQCIYFITMYAYYPHYQCQGLYYHKKFIFHKNQPMFHKTSNIWEIFMKILNFKEIFHENHNFWLITIKIMNIWLPHTNHETAFFLAPSARAYISISLVAPRTTAMFEEIIFRGVFDAPCQCLYRCFERLTKKCHHSEPDFPGGTIKIKTFGGILMKNCLMIKK